MMKITEMQDAGTFVATSLSISEQIQNGKAINANLNSMMLRNLQTASVAKGPASEFNSVVFWSINAVWLALVMGVVLWIWKFNGAHYLCTLAQRMAGIIASEDGDRRDVDTEKPVPPEARRTLLKDYFRKAKVHMVSHFFPVGEFCLGNVVRLFI